MTEYINASLSLDNASNTIASLGTIFAGLVLLGFFAQRVSDYSHVSIFSLAEYIWHGIVCLVPGWLVPSRFGQRNSGTASSKYAAKSQALRSIFGFDRTSLATAGPSVDYDAPKGLGNWDNSCYQNSVLQGLSSLPSVSDFLMTYNRLSETATIDTTTQDLANLLSELNDQSSSTSFLWTPSRLKFMDSWQQQDAQEYYARILDEVEKDFVKILRQKNTVGGIETLGTDKPECCNRSSRDTDHKLTNPLEGLLAQRVGCSMCGYIEGLSLIPFTSITLPLPNMFSCDVAECLDGFTALESIEGVECLKCTLLQARDQLLDAGDPGPAIIGDGSSVEEASETSEPLAYSNRLLQTIEAAIEDEDFTDATLAACQISKAVRATSTKTRQAVIMRPPQSLALHFNRSMFDETTGDLRKNYAAATYPKTLSFGQWCLGGRVSNGAEKRGVESWTSSSPTQSILSAFFTGISQEIGPFYRLCAVVTHFGRHDNGHYVCFRRVPAHQWKAQGKRDSVPSFQSLEASVGNIEPTWWRISDEKVSAVPEREALAQEGAFMLFYEKIDDMPRRAATRENLSAVLEDAETKKQVEAGTDSAVSNVTEHESGD